jgi:hypothetical protein
MIMFETMPRKVGDNMVEVEGIPVQDGHPKIIGVLAIVVLKSPYLKALVLVSAIPTIRNTQYPMPPDLQSGRLLPFIILIIILIMCMIMIMIRGTSGVVE